MQFQQQKNKVPTIWEKSQKVQNTVEANFNRETPIQAVQYLHNGKAYESDWQVTVVGGHRISAGSFPCINFSTKDTFGELLAFNFSIDLNITEELLPYVQSNILLNSPLIEAYSFNISERPSTIYYDNWNFYREGELIYSGDLVPGPSFTGSPPYKYLIAQEGNYTYCKYKIPYLNYNMIGWQELADPNWVPGSLVYWRSPVLPLYPEKFMLGGGSGAMEGFLVTENFTIYDEANTGVGYRNQYFLKIGDNKYRLYVNGYFILGLPIESRGDEFTQSVSLFTKTFDSNGNLINTSSTASDYKLPWFYTKQMNVGAKLIVSFSPPKTFKEDKIYAI